MAPFRKIPANSAELRSHSCGSHCITSRIASNSMRSSNVSELAAVASDLNEAVEIGRLAAGALFQGRDRHDRHGHKAAAVIETDPPRVALGIPLEAHPALLVRPSTRRAKAYYGRSRVCSRGTSAT